MKMVKAGRANNTGKKNFKCFFLHFIFIKHSNKIRLFVCIFYFIYLPSHKQPDNYLYLFFYVLK